MKTHTTIILSLLLLLPASAMADDSLFLLPGVGSAEFASVTPDSGRQSVTAYSLQAGMLINRYVSGEVEWLRAHGDAIQLDSVSLYLAHRRAFTQTIYAKARLGLSRDRLDSSGILPATRQYGVSGGLALGWKFSGWDVEMDYTKLERDIQTLTFHFALFK